MNPSAIELLVSNSLCSVMQSFMQKNYDFSHIVGQQFAKRALDIAAARRHNIIMQGPPGS